MSVGSEGATIDTADLGNAVRQLIAELAGLPVESMAAELRLIDELALDSLELIELLMVLEERWGITLTRDRLMKLVTVGDVVALVKTSYR
ncbi:Acyl carrier protein [Pandoraea horticolens]|uniref:Acyl carrier protein n=1 Tax=Pandoraea horticolens TaxID=2508298 RepID=A0A5E4XJU7_9BURK|nr:phosphopantetheine-binding protein [Pandoraea horticolens]VVE36739.1 Acyl carrier protein [Pandoraea horticolens]